MKNIKKVGYTIAGILGILILSYGVSLFFYDTNNILNCSGKDTWNYKINGPYDLQDLANKARSAGYEVGHYPEELSIVKKHGNKYFQKFIIYPPQGEIKEWRINLTSGSGYCKIKEATIKKDGKLFLSEFNIETEWLDRAAIEKFHYTEFFDITPDISL